MKPSVELFKLIKSLTKSEKRFFKLSSALQSGEKNYVKIFDFIDSQDDYDEDALKQEFKGETFVKHLSSEKNHLYKIILKSLRSYYSEESVASILKQEIKNIEILFNKALYQECGKFIQRAKKMAEESEEFYYWNEIISWEKKLKEEAYDHGFVAEDLTNLIAEEESVIESLRNLAEYQIIYSKINHIFRSGGFIRNEFEEKQVEAIADYHLIKGKNTAISQRASSMCYYIKGLCAATNRNFIDSFQFFNKTRDILDRHPIIKQDLRNRYIQTLTFLLRCYIDSKQFDEAEKILQDLRGLKNEKGFNSIDTEFRIDSNAFFFELLWLQRQGRFQDSIKLLVELNSFIENYKDIITKEQYIVIQYYAAVSYFAVQDYKKALTFVNEILNDNELHIRQDIYSFARIFNLVLHFELQNYDFTEYVIKSVNRYLTKHGRDYATETMIIRNIRKLSKNIIPDEQHAIFMELEKELADVYSDHHQQVIQEYFNLSAWVKSKVNRTSYTQEVIAGLKSK